MLFKSKQYTVSIGFFKDTVCKTMHSFVPEGIINPLWPGLEKEESVPHIALIPFHLHVALIIASSHKDHENLEHM